MSAIRFELTKNLKSYKWVITFTGFAMAFAGVTLYLSWILINENGGNKIRAAFILTFVLLFFWRFLESMKRVKECINEL